MMRTLIILLAVLVVVLGAAWYFIAVDGCADTGGRWIETENRCEYCYNPDGSYVGGSNCQEPPPPEPLLEAE